VLVMSGRAGGRGVVGDGALSAGNGNDGIIMQGRVKQMSGDSLSVMQDIWQPQFSQMTSRWPSDTTGLIPCHLIGKQRREFVRVGSHIVHVYQR
jgi:hypothetical protein